MTGPAGGWPDPATGARDGTPYGSAPYDGAPYAGPPTTAPAWAASGNAHGTPGYDVDHGGAPYGGAPYGGAPYGGAPYGGAPYGGAPYGGTAYGGAPYGGTAYGWAPPGAPWTVPPAAARRPGQVLAAAVLAFVQAAVVGFSSAYLLLLVSVVSLAGSGSAFPADGDALATEGTVLASVQLGTVVLLVAGAVMGLGRRRAGRLTLLAGLGSQVALALYWAVRLWALAGDSVGPPPAFVLLVAVCYAAVPGVALGLLATRQARAWATDGAPAASAAGAPVLGR